MEQQKRLFESIEKILANDGFKVLGINIVTKEAKVSKGYVYKTYGSFENLLEEYFKTKDYWSTKVKMIDSVLSENPKFKMNDLINFYLKNQYYNVFNNAGLKELIIQSIQSKNDPLMKKFIEEREKVGEEFFGRLEVILKDSATMKSFRALSAINVAALYFLSCHFSSNNGTFCGLDLTNEEDLNEVFSVIESLNGLYLK